MVLSLSRSLLLACFLAGGFLSLFLSQGLRAFSLSLSFARVRGERVAPLVSLSLFFR